MPWHLGLSAPPSVLSVRFERIRDLVLVHGAELAALLAVNADDNVELCALH